MKRLKNYTALVGLLILALITTSCNTKTKKEEDSTSKLADLDQASTYISADNKYEFSVLSNSDSAEGLITLHDVKTDTNHNLKRVPSASGIKYENKEGWVFWTKDDTFILYHNDKEITKGHLKTAQVQAEASSDSISFNNAYYGNYVSDGYSSKDDGADWVAVTVKPIDDYHVKVSIRSRADKKRASCTYDGISMVNTPNTLKVFENKLTILLQFNNGQLTIATDPESDNDKLSFYCSGGGSLVGNYSKIEGNLDQQQIDKTGYLKSLTYKDYLFIVEEKDGQLTVKPIGLSETNAPLVETIKGDVTNAEIGDLNNDSFPELFVYTQHGDQLQGQVYGYSVNAGKSMSTVNTPLVKDLKDVNEGYQGHDEFAMVEGTFVQRFPIYIDGQPSGKTKQIQFGLEEGEAMRQLVVDKVVEY